MLGITICNVKTWFSHTLYRPTTLPCVIGQRASHGSETDIPVLLFIRVTKRDDEAGARALLIGRDERRREFTVVYVDETGYTAI